MKNKIYILFIFNLILLFNCAYAFSTRNELNRFTLLHDRILVIQSLKNSAFSNYFNIDLYVSSRFKDFALKLQNSAGKGASGTLDILSKDINTEYFLDLDLSAAIPLPDLKIFGKLIIPNIFFNINPGLSLSDSNNNSITNPEIQIYLRQQIKIGLHFLTNLKHSKFSFSIYQIKRADNLKFLDTLALELNKKLIDSKSLSQYHTYFAADFSLNKYIKNDQHLVELKELQIYSKSNHHSKYGTLPFLHYRYLHQWNLVSNISSILGIHARVRYSLGDGIYAGLKWSKSNTIPFKVDLLINNQFINLNPAIMLKYFYFSYSLMLPYSNPQNNLWVGSIHNINISIPLP